MPNGSLVARTIVICGGSRGLGLAMGIGAARQGASVVLLAKTDTPSPAAERCTPPDLFLD